MMIESDMFHRTELYGKKVVVSDYMAMIPRVTLSDKVAKIVTPEFKREMELWMADFFGYRDDLVYHIDDTLFMSPRKFRQLKELVTNGFTFDGIIEKYEDSVEVRGVSGYHLPIRASGDKMVSATLKTYWGGGEYQYNLAVT